MQTSDGKKLNHQKKSTPLLYRVMVSLLVLAFLQIFVFAGLLIFTGGLSNTVKYSYDLLLEKTQNRKSYVESVFNEKVTLVYQTALEVDEAVGEILAKRGATAADICADRELNKQILDSCAEQLIELMRQNRVNDTYLILDSGSLYDKDGKALRSGIYLRDTDIDIKEEHPTDNGDIFLEMGSSRIAKDYRLPMDYDWSVYLDVTDEESGNFDFYYQTIKGAREYGNIPLYCLGYWSGMSRISAEQQPSLKYTMPLIAEDGTVYGVIGIGILEKTILQNISAAESLSESTFYALGLDRQGDGEYHMLLHQRASFGRLMGTRESLGTQKRIQSGLYDFTGDGGPKLVGSVQELNLYYTGSPYRMESWALISVAEKREILSAYYSLIRVLVISLVISLGVSVVFALFISYFFSRPVKEMALTIENEKHYAGRMELQVSGITEIDTLGKSVMDLQNDLEEYASRVSRIVTMAGGRIGVFQYDIDDDTVFVGESLAQILNFRGITHGDATVSHEEFRTCLSALDPGERILSLPIFSRENVQESQSASREIDYPGEDGGTVWLKFSLTRDKSKVMGLVQDITDTTSKLLETNAALKLACEAAERANTTKTEFLSRMSHDIRTPMNAIIGMTTIAKSHLNEPERIGDCLNKIGSSGEYLLALINEVLDMSKIEAGKFVLTKEPIHLPELVQRLLDMIRPTVKAKRHELEVRIEPLEHEYVISDQLRIQQIFMNIMSNAVKYTKEGGKLSFALTEKYTGKKNVGCYEFVFSDNGKGMSPEFLKKLFTPFEREEDVRVSKQQGTGLGMTITYNIVKLMNGKIRVESEPDRGTTFWVTLYLPLDKTAQAEQGEKTKDPEEVRSDFSGHRVLLVDDNELNREIAVEILRMMNIAVETAADGQEAVERFEGSPAGYYEMIFMDIQMPVMDGYAATGAIRALPREDARTIPIVAMTANAFAEDVRASQEAGMDGHIAKPMEIGRLREELGKFLKTTQTAQGGVSKPGEESGYERKLQDDSAI